MQHQHAQRNEGSGPHTGIPMSATRHEGVQHGWFAGLPTTTLLLSESYRGNNSFARVECTDKTYGSGIAPSWTSGVCHWVTRGRS